MEFEDGKELRRNKLRRDFNKKKAPKRGAEKVERKIKMEPYKRPKRKADLYGEED